MGKLKWILIILAILVVIGAGGYGLYILGDSDQSALERLRDIAILVIGLFALVTVVLMLVITGLLLYLTLTIKDRVIPIMETLQDTAERVKGTTEFLSEEVAAPVISVYGTVARARTMTRVVTGRDRGNERKTIARLLKR
jgi:hypothetical protein